jgi:hypothetical protein
MTTRKSCGPVISNMDRSATISRLMDSIMGGDGCSGERDLLEDALLYGREGFNEMNNDELMEQCEVWQVEPVERTDQK